MPNTSPAGPMSGFSYAEDKTRFTEHRQDAVPYRVIPDSEGGFYIACAWGDDPTTGTRFGEVFHIKDAVTLGAFLTQSFSYWAVRRQNDLARGAKLRAAREQAGGRKTRTSIGDPLAKLNLGEIKLKL